MNPHKQSPALYERDHSNEFPTSAFFPDFKGDLRAASYEYELEGLRITDGFISPGTAVGARGEYVLGKDAPEDEIHDEIMVLKQGSLHLMITSQIGFPHAEYHAGDAFILPEKEQLHLRVTSPEYVLYTCFYPGEYDVVDTLVTLPRILVQISTSLYDLRDGTALHND